MEVEPIPVAVIAALAAQLPPPIVSTPEEITARRAIRQAKLPPPQPWRKRRYVLVTEEPEIAIVHQVEPEKSKPLLDILFDRYRIVQNDGERAKLFKDGEDTGHQVTNALLAAGYALERQSAALIEMSAPAVRKFTRNEYDCFIALELLRSAVNKLPDIDDTAQPQRFAELLHDIDREIRVRPLMGALDTPNFEPLE